MARAAWRPIRGVDLAQLRQARLQAHHAVQWLVRAARAFVPPRPDDSHTNLGWDDALDGFATHPLKGRRRLCLRIPQLTLVLTDANAPESLALDGRTDANAHHWLGRRLAAHDLDPAGLAAKLPYDIPDHPVAHGATYDLAGLADALADLATWFANADRSLGRVREQMIGRGLAPSPVRTWPHHFDMATLTLLEPGSAEHARSVNAGLSPGDEHYEEPYFYVSPHPYPDPASLLPVPEPGHWHVRGFTAAIAPASRVIATRDCQAATEAFLNTAIAAAIAALS